MAQTAKNQKAANQAVANPPQKEEAANIQQEEYTAENQTDATPPVDGENANIQPDATEGEGQQADGETTNKEGDSTEGTPPVDGETANKPEEKAKEETREELVDRLSGLVPDVLNETEEVVTGIMSFVREDTTIDKSWASEIFGLLTEVRSRLSTLSEQVLSRPNVKDANLKAFFESKDFRDAVEAAEVMDLLVKVETEVTNKETGEVTKESIPDPETGGLPRKLFDHTFGKFVKPHSGDDAASVPLGRLSIKPNIDIRQLDRPETVAEGRPVRGYSQSQQGNGASSDEDKKPWVDRTGRYPTRISFDQGWEAWMEEGPSDLRRHLTDEDRKTKNFYKSGSPFFKRLEREGHIDKAQGYLTKWYKGQTLSDGSRRFVYEGNDLAKVPCPETDKYRKG